MFGALPPAARAAALERLAESGPAPRRASVRRLLLVANPHATTMSARLRQLVVRALERGYEVDAVDTQRPRPRDGDQPRRRARRLRRGGRPRRRRDDQRGGQRPRRHGHGARLPSGRRHQRLLPHDRHLHRRRARHGAALGPRGRVGAAPRRPRPRQRPLVHLLRRRGARRRAWSSGSTPARELKARFGPWFYAQSALDLPRHYVVDPPRVVVRAAGAEVTGRRASSSRTRSPTRTSRSARCASRRARTSTPATSPASCSPARARWTSPRSPSACSPGGRAWRATAGCVLRRLHELRVRSYDDRPVPVQVDGDYIGAHEEAVFSVSPGGLRVVAG